MDENLEFVDAVPIWQDQHHHPPPRRRFRWLLVGGAALALLLALGLGALLGSQFLNAQAAASGGASNQGTGFAPGGPISFQNSGQMLAGTPGAHSQCASFTVTAVNGSTITAKAADGSTVTIHTTSSTKYTHNGQSATSAAVTVGSRISVMGSHNSDGSITATSIDVS
jgi:Domain of unknown function (DUF5666)